MIATNTNGSQRKREYNIDTEDGQRILALIPENLYGDNNPTVAAEYLDSNKVGLYFKRDSSFENIPSTDTIYSLKYNPDDNSHYFKYYLRGNTTENTSDGVSYTGHVTNSSDYTLYFGDENDPLLNMITEEGLLARTYDENHNLLFESRYHVSS